MKINKPFSIGLFTGAFIMLLLFLVYFFLSPSMGKSGLNNSTSDNSEICRHVATYLDYIDSVADRINIENHVDLEVAEQWESLSDKEKIHALLYNYSYDEILTVRKNPNLTHRDILGARNNKKDSL